MRRGVPRKIADSLARCLQRPVLHLVVFSIAAAAGNTRGARNDKSEVASFLSPDDRSGEKVHLVTCSSDLDDVRVQMLLARAGHMGYVPQWLNCSDALYNGKFHWGIRMNHYQEFVESIPGDSLVTFVDAFDVITEGSSEEAASRFKEFNTPLVFSCVSYPYPFYCSSYLHKPNASPAQCSYPCGGASMGRASAYIDLFKKGGNFTPDTDDQCWLFSALYDNFQMDKEFSLDSESRLFLSYTSNTAWNVPYKMELGRHVVNVSGLESHPTFIHLDSAHPGLKELRKLNACPPGADDPACHNREGRWPDPSLKRIMDAAVCTLSVVFIVFTGVAAAYYSRMRKL